MERQSPGNNPPDPVKDSVDALLPVSTPIPANEARKLPALPASRLMGRERELEVVLSALQHQSTSVLTILGPGGVGKTRLALTAAWEIAPSFRDGVVYFRFTETSAEQVMEHLAFALDIPGNPGKPWASWIQAALHGKHLLLVLDQCEHTTEALAPILHIIGQEPEIKVLATSQEPIGVVEEQELWLAPLAIPPPVPHLTAEQAAIFSAVQVFVARAHRRDSTFNLNDDNAADIAAIVRQLDGLPLAIELAAAQTRHLSIVGLRHRLEVALPSLSSASRDLPERQRSLLGMTRWSLSLLSPQDQERFLQLGILIRDFTPELASAIVGVTPVEGWEMLISFADKSLVKRVVARNNQPTRFFLLQTMQAVARHLLEQQPHLHAAALTRLATACVEIARDAATHWHSADYLVWFERMDQEHPNIQRVFEHALGEQHLVPAALELAEPMFWFWYSRGHQAWALPRLEQLLSRAPDNLAPHIRGEAHVAAGWLAFKQTQVNRAECHFQAALQTLTDPASPSRLRARIGLAYTQSFEGRNIPEALDMLNDVTALAKTNPDAWHELAAGHFGIGLTAWFDRQTPLARNGFEKSLQIARGHGDSQSIAMNLLYLAEVDRAEGDTHHAIEHLQEVVPLFLRIGDQTNILLSLDVAVTLLVQLGVMDLAGRIATVVERLRIIQGIPRSPLEQADIDDVLQKLRQHGAMLHHTSKTSAPIPSDIEGIVEEFLRYHPELIGPENRQDAVIGTLTPRELEVLQMIADGQTSTAIAKSLFLSPHTVKRHTANIRSKLGVHSQAAAVAALHRSRSDGDQTEPR